MLQLSVGQKTISLGLAGITLLSVLNYVAPKLVSKQCVESAYRPDSTWIIPPACQQYRSKILLADIKGYVKQESDSETSPVYLSDLGIYFVLFPQPITIKHTSDEALVKCIVQSYKEKDDWVVDAPCIRKLHMFRSAATLGYTTEVDNKTYLNDRGVYYVLQLDCPLLNKQATQQ